MKHFYFDFIFTSIALMISAWWGFNHGGISTMISALTITLMLALMEVSLSFDNAVVNASLIKHWDKFWQTLFLTLGMFIAVFGMRLVFPIAIVAITADMSMNEVVQLAFNHPIEYANKLSSHHAEISAFGSMFLLLVFLNFVFDDREIHWFTWLEHKLTQLGKVEAMSVFVALAILMLSLTWISDDEKLLVLTAGIWGVLTYLTINTLASLLESSQPVVIDNLSGKEIRTMATKGGIAGFVYLEMLDASFSFDGVIGAFAISNDIVIIMLGLAIGAMFVRSLTLFLVKAGTLEQFAYLEHGAHYAIGALAIIMLLSIQWHIPELITGGIGIGFILLSIMSSIQSNRVNDHS